MSERIDTPRYACVADLNKYFKKSELLSGLTTLEQETLRKNIGVVDYTGEGGQIEPKEVTYSILSGYITNGTLVTGARYIITDFQTIYSSNTTNSSGKKITWGLTINPSKVLRLIVTAVSTKRLDQRVLIDDISTKNWIIHYDATSETLEDGVTTKGKITYLKDEKGNSAFYDFKNVRFYRASGIFYTFSDITDSIITDSTLLYNTYYNTLEEGCTNNVFLGDTYNNILQAGCTGNTFLKGCHDTTLGWSSVDNTFNENVCYLNGSIYNKTILSGDTTLSSAISKTIHKVDEATIVSYLDPTTYAYQIVKI
jgi:hypothetical protein